MTFNMNQVDQGALMILQLNTQEEFDSRLASYAAKHGNSRGRKFSEIAAPDRNEFQRDSSRVMHSSAFRRLQYKTQVFSNHMGDLFRTRLTHSLEVAQVTRASARALNLNEDLVETLALAHDLGHAPFGHLGQDALNHAMKDFGGFEHNWQALRVVDELERAYIDFHGLNLLFESREGILKHCSAANARLLKAKAKSDGDEGLSHLVDRFLPENERDNPHLKSPSLEAQLTDFCDAIAYTHADMEDAVTMGVLTLEQLSDEVPLFKAAYDIVKNTQNRKEKKGENLAPLYAKVVSGLMMKQALKDLIDTSRDSIKSSGVLTIEDVRAHSSLITFSAEFLSEHHIPFKRFLRKEVYTHPDVEQWRTQQYELVLTLFSELNANPKWLTSYEKNESRSFQRQLCDYLSGLTDRSVMQEFDRLKELSDNKSARKAINRKK